jgi:hypothetical protein
LYVEDLKRNTNKNICLRRIGPKDIFKMASSAAQPTSPARLEVVRDAGPHVLTVHQHIDLSVNDLSSKML